MVISDLADFVALKAKIRKLIDSVEQIVCFGILAVDSNLFTVASYTNPRVGAHIECRIGCPADWPGYHFIFYGVGIVIDITLQE